MYQTMPYQQLSGLGLSLKPPAWLRNIVGSVVSGTKVSIPTESGIPITVDLGDPEAVAKLKAMILGAKVSTSVGTPRVSTMDRINTGVESIPGGWFTVAAAAVVGVLVLPRLIRR